MQGIDKLKMVPTSVEAERSVLGGVLLKPDSLEDIVEIVKASDFYKGAHRNIYEAMLVAYSKGEVIDPVVLINTLKKQNKFEESGGEAILYEIIEQVPTAANILTYARIVKEKATLRKLGDIGTQIVEMTHEGYEDIDDILDKAEGMIFKIAENKESKDVIEVKDIISQEYERLEKLMDNKGMTTGISSGFKHFDEMTNGFHPSDLVILAARPAMGKTAFVLNLALEAAVEEKKSVMIFSLEMSNSQLLQRFLAAKARIPLSNLRNGFLEADHWVKLGSASSKLAESSIQIADMPNINVMEIRAMARRAKAAGKLDMIIIDYLQLIKGRDKNGESRQQEISDISRSLKIIARELEVPVIALSQLSRGPEQRADRRPMLSDLRDSGAIEQDADMVVFLYRDDYYNEDSEDAGIAEVIIGKQRNGPVGTVKLRFFHEYTQFGDYTTSIT
ncbi:replicative DNA helicase [Psychrilyobacter atlanticus]|uniref:replicative DNA helicase n=1 Tax=Psychrilyobacter atlanticus TaxID=271091 RepID=UPI000403D3C7|nr:replicative DNA helicase [Psychrilyobacter atlanticus]